MIKHKKSGGKKKKTEKNKNVQKQKHPEARVLRTNIPRTLCDCAKTTFDEIFDLAADVSAQPF